ncbi:MAG: hypothetical protein NDJ89_00995 [Oligoflexia bacterium]|nr:hypothetical protein [Oligoflexia bacterium]
MIPYDDTDEEPSCTGCGLPQEQFTAERGKGYVSKRGDLYCCRDCAEGKVCACDPARAQSA